MVMSCPRFGFLYRAFDIVAVGLIFNVWTYDILKSLDVKRRNSCIIFMDVYMPMLDVYLSALLRYLYVLLSNLHPYKQF